MLIMDPCRWAPMPALCVQWRVIMPLPPRSVFWEFSLVLCASSLTPQSRLPILLQMTQDKAPFPLCMLLLQLCPPACERWVAPAIFFVS